MEQLVFQVQEFQGPLDLLLQLITTHKMDIYDIPIRDILAQYLAQIQRMQEQNLAVSSDFLEMAARLIYIKSAQMLPKDDAAEEMPAADYSGTVGVSGGAVGRRLAFPVQQRRRRVGAGDGTAYL